MLLEMVSKLYQCFSIFTTNKIFLHIKSESLLLQLRPIIFYLCWINMRNRFFSLFIENIQLYFFHLKILITLILITCFILSSLALIITAPLIFPSVVSPTILAISFWLTKMILGVTNLGKDRWQVSAGKRLLFASNKPQIHILMCHNTGCLAGNNVP